MSDVLTTIRKLHGQDSIFKFSEKSNLMIPVIPTGSLRLDQALGVGGIPLGRIVEIYGPEASGKTTLCQHILANVQALQGQAAFVDVEHALDPSYMEKCGVDIDNVFISQPDYGEQALNIVEDLIGLVNLIIVDSVAGLVPKAELEGEMGDSHMALQARLMSQALRKIAGKAKKANTTIIFTNQLRDKIGVVWGNPQVTTGGKALAYWASMRLEVRKGQAIKDKDDELGTEIKIVVRKNKVAPPFRATTIFLRFDSGISLVEELIEYGIENSIIQKGGAWFTIGEEKFQGKQNLYDAMLSNPILLHQIEDKLRNELGLPLRRSA